MPQDHAGNYGKAAEKFFRRSLLRLGYREVETTNALRPKTFCVASGKEESLGIDFVLTPSRDGSGRARRVVPLQITIAGASLVRSRKRTFHEAGLVALFSAAGNRTERLRVVALLQMAASGNKTALAWFDARLNGVIDDFSPRQEKRLNTSSCVPIAEVLYEILDLRIGSRINLRTRISHLCAPFPEALAQSLNGGRLYIEGVLTALAEHIVHQFGGDSYDVVPIGPKSKSTLRKKPRSTAKCQGLTGSDRDVISCMLAIVKARGKRVWRKLGKRKNLGALPEQLQRQIRTIIQDGGLQNDRLDAIQHFLEEAQLNQWPLVA